MDTVEKNLAGTLSQFQEDFFNKEAGCVNLKLYIYGPLCVLSTAVLLWTCFSAF
jgi:hypothetical protein